MDTTGEKGPFSAFVALAARDPAAANALAGAYTRLPDEEREKLIDAVIADAAKEGVSAAPALVSLLATEDSVDLARRIATELLRDRCAELTPSEGPRAILAGNDRSGGVILSRPLHGDFVELIGVAWSEDGVTHAVVEPLALADDIRTHSRVLPDGLRFEDVPIAYAVDRLAEVLWSHRRNGHAIPTQLERYADLFTVRHQSP